MIPKIIIDLPRTKKKVLKVKKLISIFVVSAILAGGYSCKKGEEDPGISFRSRKARLAGDWIVSTMEKSTTTKDSDLDGTKQTAITIDGESYTKSETPFGDNPETEVTTGTVSEYSYTFSKEGEYSYISDITIKEDKEEIFSGDEYSVTTQTIVSVEGSWSFLNSSSDDYKNKERLVLNVLSKEVKVKTTDSRDNNTETDIQTYTYSMGEQPTVWHLTKLHNKEIIADWVIDNEYTDNPDGSSSSTISTTGEGKIVLTQE